MVPWLVWHLLVELSSRLCSHVLRVILDTVPPLFLLQENVKARHPQLLYESKLYKILQGGGEHMQQLQKQPMKGLSTRSCFLHNPAGWSALTSPVGCRGPLLQLASPTCAGMALRESTMSWS